MKKALLIIPLILCFAFKADRYAFSSKNVYYGVVTCSKSVFLDEKVLSNGRGETIALFSAVPMVSNSIIGASFVDAGEIIFNNIKLKKICEDGAIYYADTLNDIILPPYKCHVSGYGQVPEIDYDFNSGFPDYTGYATLPDTISLKGYNVINLEGVTNTDEIEIYISDRLHSSQRKMVSERKYFNKPVVRVVFNPDELKNLDRELGGTIEVFCYKNSYVTVNGKRYKFQTGFHLQKINVTFKS